MAQYAFICRVCRERLTITAPVGSDVERPYCPNYHGGPPEDAPLMAKDYSFSIRPMFVDGFNPSVGEYVSNPGQIRSALSRKNDEINARNLAQGRDGQLSDMAPASLSEIAARSIDGPLLDQLQREHRDSHNPAPFPKAMIDAVEKGA